MSLNYMTPRTMCDDSINGDNCNFVTCRKLASCPISGGVIIPKLLNFFLRHFGFVVIASAHHSSLIRSILKVFLWSPNEQMVRANTGWIVAMVANIMAIWDWSKIQLKRVSVCSNRSASVDIKKTVSFAVFTSVPCPTTILLLGDKFFESFFWGIGGSTIPTAKTTRRTAWVYLESFFAGETIKIHHRTLYSVVTEGWRRQPRSSHLVSIFTNEIRKSKQCR